MAEGVSFNLLTEGWLPVVDLAVGEFREIGLTEALTRAHEVRLVGQDHELLVLLRLLAAVFDAAAGPTSTSEWDAAWQATTLDTGRIKRYVTRWSHRFDLFDDTRPFAQCGHLTEFRRGPEVLDPAKLSGDPTASLFAPLMRDSANYPPHPPAQAARYLLILLGFDVAGTKGAVGKGQTYGAQVGPVSAVTHAHLTAPTLKDVLLLNLPPRPRTAGDAPVWERDCSEPQRADRDPTGRLDWLTWPARRIRLRPNESGHVDALALHDGDRPTARAMPVHALDPMSVWSTTTTTVTTTTTTSTTAIADGAISKAVQKTISTTTSTTSRKTSIDPTPARIYSRSGVGLQAPWPWRLMKLTMPPPDGEQTGWSCAAIRHVLDAAGRGVVPLDYPLTVCVSQTSWNKYRVVIHHVATDEVPLGTVGLYRDHARAVALRDVALRPMAMVAAFIDAASRIRPATNRTVPLTLEQAHVDRAWQRLVSKISTLPPSHLSEAQREFIDDMVALFTRFIERLPLATADQGVLLATIRRTAHHVPAATPREATRTDEQPEPTPTRPASARPAGRAGEVVMIGAESKTLTEWARDPRCAVSRVTLRQRLKDGMDPLKALTTPPTRGPRGRHGSIPE